MRQKKQKIKKQKIEEQKIREQKIKKQKIREQKIREQKIKKQKIKRQKIKKQKAKIQKKKKQKSKKQRIKKQKKKKREKEKMKNNRRKKVIALWVAAALCLFCLQGCGGAGAQSGSDSTSRAGESAEAGTADSVEEASKEKTSEQVSDVTAAPAFAEDEEDYEAEEVSEVRLSPEMNALKEQIEAEFAEKDGRWSMYLCRLDTGEEFGVNAQDSMISASLIKLFIAGCYFEQIEKGVIADDYPNQLYTMISESNNGSTNTLIDVLGMDTVNEFIRTHGFEASSLKRKMLEKNGRENYTSSEDCGHVLRQVYEGTYVNKEASERIMEALRGQIARNRGKIPAGVPEGVETANKTGELFTNDEKGVSVDVQNDAAIIFEKGRPYVLVVMTAVHAAGEGEMHERIASLSSEVYTSVCSMDSGGIVTAEDGHEVIAGSTGAGSTADESSEKAEEAVSEVSGQEDDTEIVREDAAVSLPIKADEDR